MNRIVRRARPNICSHCLTLISWKTTTGRIFHGYRCVFRNQLQELHYKKTTFAFCSFQKFSLCYARGFRGLILMPMAESFKQTIFCWRSNFFKITESKPCAGLFPRPIKELLENRSGKWWGLYRVFNSLPTCSNSAARFFFVLS